jgi:hypothetical protein
MDDPIIIHVINQSINANTKKKKRKKLLKKTL